jgi:hypothetical protein
MQAIISACFAENLLTLTQDVLKSSEIEGENLGPMQVISGAYGHERVLFKAQFWRKLYLLIP